MNKLLQHLIDSGDVSHKVLPSLMKFQIRGEVPAGLKPIPRSGGDMPGMKKPVIQMTAEEAKKRQLQMMAQQAVANQATVRPMTTPINREAAIERNRQYAAATGKRFNPNNGAVSPLLSDNTDRVMRRAQENIVNPMFEMEMALSGAKLAGQGFKAAGKYVVNNAGLKNASKSVSPTFGLNNSNSGLINFLNTEINPVGIAADHSFGLVKGAVEQSKNLLGKLGVLKNPPASRSFFETFPITKAQRAKVMTMQDEALADAKKFTDDYWYGNSLDVRPVLEEKMRNILPEFKMAKYDNNLERGNSPFGTVPDRLVRNTTWGKGREDLSQDMINYLNDNRGRIGGVNTDEASITLRNSGLYYKTPREIANTVAHESGHSAQNFGVRGNFDTSPYTISDYSKKTWGEQLAKFDDEYNYYTSNPDTEIGRRFQQALVSPKKSSITNKVTRQTWRSSPNEVHSELMASKYNMYKQGLRQGYTPEQMMERVTNPGQKELEWLLDNKTINKHFKKGTSKEEKLALLKLLPAAVPAVAGASMLDEKQEGGETKEYKGSSIVDYLATRGYSGKKAFRKDLASKYGVENYDYSAAKNTELLNRMRQNDDLLEAYEQTAAPVSAQRLEQMYRANLEAKKQENYNNIRRRMALDMGYDPLAGQGQFEQAQYPDLSLVPKSPYGKNSLVNGLQGTGRQPQPAPAPAAQRPANFQYVQPGKPSTQNNFEQFPGYPEQAAQPQKPVSLVSGPGNFQQFPGYSKGVAPTPRPVSLASGPGNFQQFPAYPTRQVADLPKKTTAKAAAKALEKDVDEQNWFEETASAVGDGINTAYNLGTNYAKRQYFKMFGDDDSQVSVLKQPPVVNIPKTIPGKKPEVVLPSPIVTGNQLWDEGNRVYHTPEVIDLTRTKWGYRNRGDRNEVNSAGFEFGMIDDKSNPVRVQSSKKIKLDANETYVGVDASGKMKVGTGDMFKDKEYFVGRFNHLNNVTGFKRKANGDYDLIDASGAAKDHVSPQLINSNGETKSAGLLIKKNSKNNYNLYGNITGGHVIVTSPDYKKQVLLSGSLTDVETAMNKFMKENNLSKVNFVQLDNGSYSRNYKTSDNKITAKDWEKFDNRNTSGGSGFYLQGSGMKNGGPIVDPRGQWAHPGKRTMVPTPTGQITMKGVPYPVYGQDETGYGQMMYPGVDYQFPGQMVDETPMMQNGGGLLSRSVSCSSCGHSWKSVEGGADPLHCHKCGGLVKMQGGGLWNKNKAQWADSVNHANMDKNFVQRYYLKNGPSMQIPGKEGTSTHYMEESDGMVYPTVVQYPGDAFVQYLNASDRNGAYNYAKKTGQFIKFPTVEQAAWYADNGYKTGNGVMVGKKESGGQHGGLDRWFAEKWVDVKTGKDCGRQSGEKRAGYPACRPSKRVSSQTPKTSSEMSAAEKAKFKRNKTSSDRINYNHKRN